MLLWGFTAIKKLLNFEVVEYLEPARDGETAKYSPPHYHPNANVLLANFKSQELAETLRRDRTIPSLTMQNYLNTCRHNAEKRIYGSDEPGSVARVKRDDNAIDWKERFQLQRYTNNSKPPS
ncbi:uncharacterized protein ARMOST_16135 [Armillaria ostoyae]|uniref:Uncharacterized protein n=1 Tax=Armillaria ostoyae TaxID=47428 RepID=A0A284RVD2_ARMOS|nr:uncharacterized protein ARMOST_16135 [Armillaria ostoyae]